MRAWMEINKENLKYNVLKLKELAKNREVLGVVGCCKNFTGDRSRFFWSC